MIIFFCPFLVLFSFPLFIIAVPYALQPIFFSTLLFIFVLNAFFHPPIFVLNVFSHPLLFALNAFVNFLLLNATIIAYIYTLKICLLAFVLFLHYNARHYI